MAERNQTYLDPAMNPHKKVCDFLVALDPAMKVCNFWRPTGVVWDALSWFLEDPL